MMASFMSYFGAGRKDPKQTARDAIVGLRQQLQMIEKKEEYLQKKIEEETKKARANAVSNKAGTLSHLLPPPHFQATTLPPTLVVHCLGRASGSR
jgi:charged multivesicular body protein 4